MMNYLDWSVRFALESQFQNGPFRGTHEPECLSKLQIPGKYSVLDLTKQKPANGQKVAWIQNVNTSELASIELNINRQGERNVLYSPSCSCDAHGLILNIIKNL